MIPHGVDRRRFLRMATVGALAGTSAFGRQQAQAGSNPPQVLIIGAGLSGVAAAFWLRALGISAVILEANDRVGGRINTSFHWPDAPLDLGAAWIHESANSPITPIANAFNIPTFLTNFEFLSFGIQNQLLSFDQFAEYAFDYGYLAFLVENYTNLYQYFRFPDQPLGNVINPILNSFKLSPENYAGVQTLLEANIRNHLGVELNELSLYYWDKNQNVTQSLDRAFPTGYVQVVNGLLTGSQQPLVLGCKVQQLIYNQPYGVTAVTNKGNFSAKYAIVTLPIGVLQRSQGADPLVQFTPALPPWKLFAINGLAMGVWDKLAMRFPTNFWGNKQLLRNTQPNSQYNVWFNPAPMLNKPILVPVVSGNQAKIIETLTDQQVQAGLMSEVIPWFKANGIDAPPLCDFQRSSWGTNPYSYGCYPHIPPGGSPANYDLMSLPVSYGNNPRLLFAGDGTDRNHCGATWGAYVSGVREAVRLWTYLNPGKSAASLARRRLSGVNLGAQFHPAQIWQSSQAKLQEAYRIVARTSKKK